MAKKKCPEVVRGNTSPDLNDARTRLWPSFTSFLETPPIWNPKAMKYLIYGEEICPTTQRKHWQGFVYFKEKQSQKNAQKLLGIGKSHIESFVKDSVEAAIDYCRKDKIVSEYGEPPSQGKRTDLLSLAANISGGVQTVDQITVSNPMAYHQYGRTLERLEDIYLRTKFRTEMTKGFWYWGPTGVGKSHKAFENFSHETHYVYKNDNGWWEGYTGQEVVIINDFRGEIRFSELLTLIDIWPTDVKRRGRPPMPFTSKKVIITSSLPPAMVYHNINSRDSIAQLLDRVEVIEMTGENMRHK